nr:immunoglobulin binding protein 1 [Hymenolepis microstoma]
MQVEGSLPNFFDKILQNYLKIKKDEIVSSDEGFKDLIEQSCALCDEAMRRINQLDLFSKNESLDDLSTSSIRYITLPAFLAFYTSQKFDRDERLISLKLTQTYYDEFFDLIESYGFPDLPKREKPSGDEPSSNLNPRSVRVDPEKQRNERIKAHKEKKSLDERLEKFLSLNSPIVDEEMLREESIGLVRYWAFTAVEDLRLIKSEVELLEKFQGQRRPQQPLPRPKPSSPTQPPLVITREKILAATFGAGYPSVPTMTLDQFVDLQVKQGLMPAPQQMKSRTSTNNSSNGASWHRIGPSDTAEAKKAEEEKLARYDALEDAHSEEQRAKAQRFDEFKDEHRRGSGNRANRG